MPVSFTSLTDIMAYENPAACGAMVLRNSHKGPRAYHKNVMSYKRMVVLPIEALSQVSYVGMM